MRDKTQRKSNIISIRMSDDERADIQMMMETRNKKASSIMREAFNLFREQWELSQRMQALEG